MYADTPTTLFQDFKTLGSLGYKSITIYRCEDCETYLIKIRKQSELISLSRCSDCGGSLQLAHFQVL